MIDHDTKRKRGIAEAKAYLQQMRAAVPYLHNSESPYFGRQGHLRLARECGAALNDFTEEARQEILTCSYGMIYVTGCALRPLLDATEWIAEMQRQIRPASPLMECVP